jgi:hypothetical protein
VKWVKSESVAFDNLLPSVEKHVSRHFSFQEFFFSRAFDRSATSELATFEGV